MVQRLCVAGSGPNVKPLSAAALFSWSQMTPGSNHGGPAVGVKLFNPGQVTRRVDNHRNVHGLTAHRRARAACEYGYIRLMACTHHRDDVFDCARQDDAYRYLSVVRCFGSVCRSRPGIKPNLGVRRLSELALQRKKLVEVGA